MEPAAFDQVAFVDAYGDTQLDVAKTGTTTFFIISAVLVAPGDATTARTAADGVRSAHFGTKEMKSNSVGASDERRLRILADIQRVPFKYYALVVDKRLLSLTSGMVYKRSFLKYLHQVLFKRLFRKSVRTRLIVDEHGRAEFMDEFCRYVQRTFVPELFHQRADISFAGSSGEPLIQMADFISGTLARAFDPKKVTSAAGRMLELLRPMTLRVDEWPHPRQPPPFADEPDGASPYDKLVYDYCVEQFWSFVQQHIDTLDEDLRRQTAVAEHLLHHLRFVDEHQFVQLTEMATDLGLPADTIRRNVIASLRDAGVLIASSTRGGYKIPSCVADMDAYVSMAGELICPLLRRISEARKALYVKTDKRLDILEGERHAGLRALLEAPEGDIFPPAEAQEARG